MRGRAAVILLSLLLVSRLSAQCGYSNGYSGEFRASYLDLAIDGNDLWTATGYGLQLFDRSVDPPALVASIAIPGTTRVVRVVNGIAYAASGAKIYAIRRSNRTLAIAGAVDAGATVNDLLATPLDLYAATSAGLLQYDLLNPASPSRTSAAMLTSSANVTSLALSGSTLYAADGDNSVEIFSITIASLPQHTGTVASLPRSLIVRSATNRLYVSDGLSTDVFVVSGESYSKTSNANIGANAFATLASDNIAFMAGTDRRVHAIDWTTPASPVELFATDVTPSGGNINRPAAFAVAGGRLYVAGGDAGLETFDIASFLAPFAVRSYGGPPTTSTAWVRLPSGDVRLYASRADGGIEEFTKSGSGYLTASRQWDTRTHTLWGGENGFLLSSTGSLLTYWTLASTSPTLVSSATFPAAITGAALSGSNALVILADQSVWSADLSRNPATTSKFAATIGGISTSATSIARSGSGVVLERVRDDGSTDLVYFASADLSTLPRTVNLPGASVTGVSLAGSVAAVFTYSGITLYDFAAGTATVLPQSNTALARQLVLTGPRVFELTDSSLVVWDAALKNVVRTMPLPAEGGSLSIDSIAGIATGTGVMTAAFDSSLQLPALLAVQNPNTYYRKVLAAGDRLYLFDGRAVDVYSTAVGLAPHYVSSIRQQGLVDFAVNATRIFTLSSSGAVGAWTRDAVALAQTTLSEGSNVQSLAIATGGDAVWVAIARGCLSGACEKKTIVFDGTSLARTASLDGAVVDATTSAGRTWAIFDLPAEVRLYNTGNDPLHPSLLSSVAASGSRTPVSLAMSNGSLYVLGDRLYVYPAADLTQHTENLAAYQSDPGGAFAYVDQRIRIDGACTWITGRSFSPQLFQTSQWSGAASIDVPAPVRSVAQPPGRIYLLTDDSLEVLATDQGAPAPRRRASH